MSNDDKILTGDILNDDLLQDKAVFIFGAGLSGQSAFKKLKQRCNVKGFIDNSANKYGGALLGVEVCHPQQWIAHNHHYDLVLIASEHFESILYQLQNQLNVSPQRIIILPARMTKPINLGDSKLLQDNAYKIMFLVTDVFESNQLNYYLDAGTLLGIHRDGKLIPWDDDIDVAVNAADKTQTEKALRDLTASLAQLFGIPWACDVYYSDKAFGAVPKGAVRGYKLRSEQRDENLPMIDLFVKYVQGDTMDYTLSSRGIRMPSAHLLNTHIRRYRGKEIRLPFDVDGYLTAHYGDWRTPMKDWNLSMLQNARVY